MPRIDIEREHHLGIEAARSAVDKVAASMQEKFGLSHRWQGDVLHFNRSGVDGRIAVEPRELHVTAKLGFLLAAMKGPIEQEIRRVLGEKF